MKKILLASCISVIVLASCKKEPDTVSQVVTISFPNITIKGAKFVTLNVGGTFVDSGASYTDSFTGETGTLTADTGTDAVPVDVSTPGLYTITYSFTNRNTFGTTVARYVAVTNFADTKSIAGAYRRTENTNPATVTRRSRALYSITDIGAAAAPAANPAYFAILDTNAADFGIQYTETLHAFFETDVKYFRMRPGDTSIQYALFGVPGYGTAVRTLKKQ